MLVVQAEPVGRRLAITGDEAGLVVDEAALQDVVQEPQGLLLEGGVLAVPAERVQLVGSADGVGRPAGAFEIAEVVPAHDVAVFVHEAGLAAEIALVLDQRPLHREADGVLHRIQDRVVGVLRQTKRSPQRVTCALGISLLVAVFSSFT